jgi:hypothetical protein
VAMVHGHTVFVTADGLMFACGGKLQRAEL